MVRLAAFACAFLVLALPARADRAENLSALYSALGLTEMVGIMREEGIAYGTNMEADLFPGRGGPSWLAVVEKIYDTAAMTQSIRDGLDKGLKDDQIEPLVEFFSSNRGQRIIGYEISARQAMMDDDVEAAAEEQWQAMRDNGAERLTLLEGFINANDLIESNVMGAMNSNYAFYLGLLDGGAFPQSLSERDVLADVWSQEDDVRQETQSWVWSYLTMAYQPLEDSDIEAYIALSETEAGRAMNRALFNGFDEMYVGISRALGVAAAGFMAGEDI